MHLIARITYRLWRLLRGRFYWDATGGRMAEFQPNITQSCDHLGLAIFHLEAALELADTRELEKRLRAERRQLERVLSIIERWAPLPKAKPEPEPFTPAQVEQDFARWNREVAKNRGTWPEYFKACGEGGPGSLYGSFPKEKATG